MHTYTINWSLRTISQKDLIEHRLKLLYLSFLTQKAQINPHPHQLKRVGVASIIQKKLNNINRLLLTQ